MTIQTQVIVIGGGIAGALSSLICCMAKYKVIWIKKNNKFFGGIQLPPNTIKCLERLGLEELLKEIAIPISEIRIRNPLKLSDLKAFSVENYYTVNRMSLFQQLLNSLKKYSSLKILSSSIIHFNKEKNSYICTTEAGEKIKADLIIGADGFSGVTRKYILGTEKKTNSVKKIRRTTIKIDSNNLIIENSINLWIGNGWHCVIYPIDRKTLNIVLVSIKIPNFENYSNPILKKLCDVNWYVSDIINNIDGPTYCFENIALIGDSAHPFPPHLAQGGAQTFEDSIILYESLLKFGISNAMLLNYSNERASKVKKIMQFSTYAGDILSLRGGNSILRNKLIEFSGPLINNYLKRLWSF